MLIYQKHDPHRIDEVFEQLMQSSKSRPRESLDLLVYGFCRPYGRDTDRCMQTVFPSFLSRAQRRIVIILSLGKAEVAMITWHKR